MNRIPLLALLLLLPAATRSAETPTAATGRTHNPVAGHTDRQTASATSPIPGTPGRNAPEPEGTHDETTPEDSPIPASFEGGDCMVFRRWVLDRLVFPASQFRDGEQLSARLSFTVARDGSVKRIELSERSDTRLGAQLREIAAASPAWTPARKEDKPVDSRIDLRFDLRLHNVGSGATPLLRADDRTLFLRADRMPSFGDRPGPGPFVGWLRSQAAPIAEDSAGASRRYGLRFVVEKDGTVSSIKVRNETDPRTAVPRELIETIRNCPAWQPGMQQGLPVRVQLHIDADLSPQADTTDYASDFDPALDQLPRFGDGSLSDFRRWVMNHLTYPPAAVRKGIEGRVLVAFVVGTDGRLEHIRILESPDERLSQAVLKTLGKAPRWSPGTQNGLPVRVKYTLPIDFKF